MLSHGPSCRPGKKQFLSDPWGSGWISERGLPGRLHEQLWLWAQKLWLPGIGFCEQRATCGCKQGLGYVSLGTICGKNLNINDACNYTWEL